MQITTNRFHRIDAAEKVVLRKQLRRGHQLGRSQRAAFFLSVPLLALKSPFYFIPEYPLTGVMRTPRRPRWLPSQAARNQSNTC